MKRDLLIMLCLGIAITIVMVFLSLIMGGRDQLGFPLATGISITVIGIVLILLGYLCKWVIKKIQKNEID